jgi:hypothetical protein
MSRSFKKESRSSSVDTLEVDSDVEVTGAAAGFSFTAVAVLVAAFGALDVTRCNRITRIKIHS